MLYFQDMIAVLLSHQSLFRFDRFSWTFSLLPEVTLRPTLLQCPHQTKRSCSYKCKLRSDADASRRFYCAVTYIKYCIHITVVNNISFTAPFNSSSLQVSLAKLSQSRCADIRKHFGSFSMPWIGPWTQGVFFFFSSTQQQELQRIPLFSFQLRYSCMSFGCTILIYAGLFSPCCPFLYSPAWIVNHLPAVIFRNDVSLEGFPPHFAHSQ